MLCLKRVGQAILLCVSIVALLLLAGACQRTKFQGKDVDMMHAAKLIAAGIDNYFSDTSDYPAMLRDAEPYLPDKLAWPVNPYTNMPIEDAGSPTFDPAKSVGMVAYERIWREEQQVSYQLHVFGEKGKLYVIGNTAVRLKE